VARTQIGVVGLGKLGMPYAETLAKTYDVLGYDIRQIDNTEFEVFNEAKKFLSLCDLLFVVLPTPHEPGYDGCTPTADLPPKDFSYEAIKNFLRLAAEFDLAIVIVSTVLPGTCRTHFAPLLSSRGSLLYLPAFAAMGEVHNGLTRPDIVVLGTSNGLLDNSTQVREIITSYTNGSEIQIMTWEEAESVKIFYNTFIGLKLMFVNTIQDVAMRISNANVDNITRALLKSENRMVSSAYMRAGMGDGGPCHPRDNIAMRELSRRLELGYDIFSTIMASREQQMYNIAKYAAGYGMDVVVVGKSYKIGLNLDDGSSSILLAGYLRQLGKFAGFFEDIVEGQFDSAKTFILAHEQARFYELPFCKGSVVIDVWRRCPPISGCTVKHYGDST
jgi:UDPglucose 6-dehydrogenase